MKAIGYKTPLDIEHKDSLVDIEIERPTASGRDLLVKVEAISVNPVDTKIRKSRPAEEGHYAILGWDAVGEVVSVGESVELFKVGDMVWYAGDISRPGSNAEYQLVDERIVGKKPESLSNAQAAAMPLTAITAWELLFDRLDFKPSIPGDTGSTPSRPEGSPNPRVLIIGAAGGVGSILTQLALKLTEATVIGTASRPESKAWVEELGAHHVINHHQDFKSQLNELGIEDLSHVISLTHTGQHFDKIVEALAPQGKLALIDDPSEAIDIRKFKAKSLSLHWELMFTRSLFNTWDILKQHHLLNTVSQLVDRGDLKTTVGENYGTINAENLKKAHTLIESNKAVGKLVLEGF